MSKILKISLAAIVAAILGVGALWWFVVRSDAPPEAALPDRSSETTAAVTDGGASDPTTTTTASGGADGEWRVVPGDEVWVGYRVQEELGPNALHNTAVGRTPTVEGTLSIADSVVESVDVTADLTDLESDENRRDNRIRTDAIETDTFPFATFALTEPIDLGEIPAIGEAVPATATGDLTIHGVTKPVTLVVQQLGKMKDPWGAEKQGFSASTTVNRLDYGLRWNVALEAGGVLVADEVKITIEAQFARESA